MLNQKLVDEIIAYVKGEPKTIQEVSKVIGKSWVTTESYVKKIRDNTGLVNIKTFRKGTKGALKIVYFNQSGISSQELKEVLLNQIRTTRNKKDFDFFEIFQFIKDNEKKIIVEDNDELNIGKNINEILNQVESNLYIFSGNMSFINSQGIIDSLEKMLFRKVNIKIICRVNIPSISNISKLNYLINKYKNQIEIRHYYHPLRGFVIDNKLARFKSEEIMNNYKPGELNKDMLILYYIKSEEWINWFSNVFWKLWRSSIDYELRMKQLEKYF